MIIWVHVNIDVLICYKILLKHKVSHQACTCRRQWCICWFQGRDLDQTQDSPQESDTPVDPGTQTSLSRHKNKHIVSEIHSLLRVLWNYKMSKSRSKIPEWLWLMYSQCFLLLCLGLRVGIDMDFEHGVHKTLREQPQMFWWGTWWTASLHHTHGQCGSSGSCGGNLRGKHMQTSVERHYCWDKGLSLLSVQTRHCGCI